MKILIGDLDRISTEFQRQISIEMRRAVPRRLPAVDDCYLFRLACYNRVALTEPQIPNS